MLLLAVLLLLALGLVVLSLHTPPAVSAAHPSTFVLSPLGIFPLLHALLPP